LTKVPTTNLMMKRGIFLLITLLLVRLGQNRPRYVLLETEDDILAKKSKVDDKVDEYMDKQLILDKLTSLESESIDELNTNLENEEEPAEVADYIADAEEAEESADYSGSDYSGSDYSNKVDTDAKAVEPSKINEQVSADKEVESVDADAKEETNVDEGEPAEAEEEDVDTAADAEELPTGTEQESQESVDKKAGSVVADAKEEEPSNINEQDSADQELGGEEESADNATDAVGPLDADAKEETNGDEGEPAEAEEEDVDVDAEEPSTGNEQEPQESADKEVESVDADAKPVEQESVDEEVESVDGGAKAMNAKKGNDEEAAGGTCYVDDKNRILPYEAFISQQNTHSKCLAECRKLGYKLAGVQYAKQCFCGNRLAARAKIALRSSDCNMPCPGDKTSFCGGPFRMNVYS